MIFDCYDLKDSWQIMKILGGGLKIWKKQQQQQQQKSRPWHSFWVWKVPSI